MRTFNYETTAGQIIDDEIVCLLTRIYELKGMHNYILTYSDIDFANMKRIARINSLIGSHQIEGVSIPLKDIEYMLDNNDRADNFNAHMQFQGYNGALDFIFGNNAKGLKSELLLEIKTKIDEHIRVGLNEYRIGDRGQFIRNFKPDGYHTRFEYQSAFGAEPIKYIDNICSSFKYAVASKNSEPLVATTIFISDYLAIYPFYQNNEKVCWLLLSYLLKFLDFNITEFISLEKIISDNIESFYQVWEHTMDNWNEGKSDYREMTKFLLKVVLQAYKRFSEYITLYNSDMSKPERVEYILKDRGYETTKRELVELCPDISETTVETALSELLRNGKIEKIGGGRYTKYRYKRT